MLFLYTLAFFFQYWLVTTVTFFTLLTAAFLILKPLPVFDVSLVGAILPFIGAVVLPSATFCATVLVAHLLAEKGIHSFNRSFARARTSTRAAVLTGALFATTLYAALIIEVAPRARILFKNLVAEKVVEIVRTLPAGSQRALGPLVWYRHNDHLLMVLSLPATDMFLMARQGEGCATLMLNDADLVIEQDAWKAQLIAPHARVLFEQDVKKESSAPSRDQLWIKLFFVGVFLYITFSLWLLGCKKAYSLVALFALALTCALFHYALLTYTLSSSGVMHYSALSGVLVMLLWITLLLIITKDNA